MKLIFRFFTFSILAIAIIVPFFLKTENGRPTLAMPSAGDFIPDKLLPDSITGNQSPASEAKPNISSHKVSFFKWQDASGAWHFGDNPPANAQNITTMNVNTNVNIIKSVKVESDSDSGTYAVSPKTQMSSSLADGELTPEDAMNVMSDAKAVRDMMEARNDALKNIVGEK